VVRDIDKELLGVERGMGAVVEQRRKKKKKTKRGPNKWMPFRRSTEGEKSVLPKSAEKKKQKDTKEKSKKMKNKSFLESSGRKRCRGDCKH